MKFNNIYVSTFCYTFHSDYNCFSVFLLWFVFVGIQKNHLPIIEPMLLSATHAESQIFDNLFQLNKFGLIFETISRLNILLMKRLIDIVYEIHFFFAYKTQLPDQHLQPHLSLNQWKQRADDSHSSTSESIWQKHSVTAICLFLSAGQMYFRLWAIFKPQTPWNRARQPYYCVDSLEHIFNKLTLISAVKYSKIKKKIARIEQVIV